MSEKEAVLVLLEDLTEADKREVMRRLRSMLPPHPVEVRLKASTETLLDAIGRANAFTLRGIEGIIAETCLATEVLPEFPTWQIMPLPENSAFDYLLSDAAGPAVRVQVKMQRRKAGLPMKASQVLKTRGWSESMWVVEIQRTRGGKSTKGGSTRPYAFGSFDILAVSLGASTGKWGDFVYSIASWLIPDPGDPTKILKYQPISPTSNSDWTSDFGEAADWLRSGVQKTIGG